MQFTLDKISHSMLTTKVGNIIIEAKNGNISFILDNGIITRYMIQDNLNQEERYCFAANKLLSFIDENDTVEIIQDVFGIKITQMYVNDNNQHFNNSLILPASSGYFECEEDINLNVNNLHEYYSFLDSIDLYSKITSFQKVTSMYMIIKDNQYLANSQFTEISGKFTLNAEEINISIELLMKLKYVKSKIIGWTYLPKSEFIVFAFDNGQQCFISTHKTNNSIDKVAYQEPTIEYRIRDDEYSIFKNLLSNIEDVSNVLLNFSEDSWITVNYIENGILQFMSASSGCYVEIKAAVALYILEYIKSNQDNLPVFISIEDDWITIKVKENIVVVCIARKGNYE